MKKPKQLQASDAVETAQVVIRDANNEPVQVPAVVSPTQVRYPSKSMIRTAFQMLVALAALWPVVVLALGLPDWAWVGAATAAAAGITRLMARSDVELFLRRFLPWLSAAPAPDDTIPNPLLGGGS